MKTNFIKIQGDVLTWRQVEVRNGITFMRAKKRSRKVFFKDDN
jgi:hypothetical protein